MKILSDNPITSTKADLFGYRSYADRLAKIIRDVKETPFTIGIFGEWGSGKTSVMRMIESKIRNEKGIKTIWFNPWKYDNKEAIWSALIQTILSEMANDEEYLKSQTKNNRKKILGKIKKIVIQFSWCAAGVGVQHLTGGMIGPRFVTDIKKAFKGNEEPYSFVNKFEEEFGRLTEEYTGGQGKIVVFIDDLDRCIPENAITALEAIKLYLDKSRCVFVIGADRGIVVQGIHSRYKEQIENFSGKDYLEKLIQLPFVIPPIEENTLNALLGKKGNPFSEFIDFEVSDKFKTLIVKGTGQNPRTLKRFLNCFSIIWGLADSKLQNNPEVIGRILLIQMRFPDFFEHVVTCPSIIYNYDAVLNKTKTLEEFKDSDLEKDYIKPDLKTFMEQTKSIPITSDLVKKVVYLARRV